MGFFNPKAAIQDDLFQNYAYLVYRINGLVNELCCNSSTALGAFRFFYELQLALNNHSLHVDADHYKK